MSAKDCPLCFSKHVLVEVFCSEQDKVGWIRPEETLLVAQRPGEKCQVPNTVVKSG